MRVQVAVDRLGERSITFAYTLTCATSGELRATVKLVHAFVGIGGEDDFKSRTAHPGYVEGLRRLGMIV